MLSILFFASCISTTYSLFSDETIRKLDRLDGYLKGKRDEVERKSMNHAQRLHRNKHVIMEGRSTETKPKLSANADIIISFEPQKYVMNIEDSVDERWGHLCAEKRYRDAYVNMYNGFDALLKSKDPDTSQQIYAVVSYYFTTFVSDPYKEEIEFFSNCTGVPLEGAITLNLMEMFLSVGCTSIVAVNDDNTIFHGRNLDLWLAELQPIVENLAFIAEYRSQGVTLFEGQSFFGYSGIFNGVKPSGFSISHNSRYTSTLVDDLTALQQGYYPSTWMIRDTLSNKANYEDALDTLMTTALIVHCYLIIGGMYYPDGAVVTRNYTDTVHVATLDDTEFEWFVPVTNYDFFAKTYDYATRRSIAIDNMNIITRSEMNSYNMFLVMRQVPTINFGTVSTSVFSASSVNDSGNAMHRNVIVRLNTTEPIYDDGGLKTDLNTMVAKSTTPEPLSPSVAAIFDKEEEKNKNVGVIVAVVVIVCLIVGIAMVIGYVCYKKRKISQSISATVYTRYN